MIGKPNHFVINLPDNFAGSNIEENVVLELSEPKRAQGILIVLSGKAYVYWLDTQTTQRGDNPTRTDTQHFFNDMTQHLWDNENESV